MKRILLLVLVVAVELAGCYARVGACDYGRRGHYHRGGSYYGPHPGFGCGCG